ncbi:hypothetical protein TI04_01840 [Achromatium sp. WMS2]|nr:hypothetical protein TI04_01840 [Achromatium sp. WMS2]
MSFWKLNTSAVILSLVIFGSSWQVRALSYQVPPIADELASPFTEMEAGGIGCVVASLALGGGMLYMLGGFGPVISAITSPMPPVRVLEGSAAAAFVFSSACYIGVTLSPITMLTYTAIVDSFSKPIPPSAPLFNRSELGEPAKTSDQGNAQP